MTRATLVSALLVPFFTFETAFATLDTIDADGVTERGGTPAQARMLTRTGTDGKLDASLLPPEGAWALPPMSRLYFVDRYAPAGGDGSVKAPFQTITDAAGAVPSGSALFLAPGNYAGVITLTAGRSLTLVGCGFLTRLSDVTVTAEGDSSATALSMANLSAVTLTINGRSTYLRAYNANIATLSGSATGVKIRRYDMGTRIGTLNLVPLENTYNGYDTVRYSEYLKGASSSKHLHMVGNRPTVGTETGAFLSDIRDVTNAVYTSIEELRSADSCLAASITTASNALAAADGAILTRIYDEVSRLDDRIDNINEPWETQMSSLVQSVKQVIADYTNMHVTVTNEIQNRKDADTGIRTDFAGADEDLHETITNEIAIIVERLEDVEIPRIASTKADERIEAKREDIIEDVKDDLQPKITAVEGGLSNLTTTVSGNSTDIGDNQNHIDDLRSKVNEIIRNMSVKSGGTTPKEIPDSW